MFKKLLIIFVAVFGVLLAVPTMWSGAAKYFPSWMHPISLGLDLKGGAQLLLEVDTATMFQEKSLQLYDEVRSAMIDLANSLRIEGELEGEDMSKAKGRLKSVFGNTVDVSTSGRTITLSYSDKQKEEMTADALARSIEIVRRRIDALGTKEPSIQSQGGKYILVQFSFLFHLQLFYL